VYVARNGGKAQVAVGNEQVHELLAQGHVTATLGSLGTGQPAVICELGTTGDE